MMREIKFRAWDKTQKRMFPVNAMAMTFLGGIVSEDYKMSGDTEWVTGYELMQYTGLNDKNGTEIYEGDIIDTGEEESNIVIVWEQKKCRFAAQWITPAGNTVLSDIEWAEVGKVIGNIYIYENPELI